MLASFPLMKEPLGLGTLLNALLIGVSVDVSLALLPDLTNLGVRIVALAVSPALIGLAISSTDFGSTEPGV
jgi:uncharacterized membrane protein YczE